MEKINEKKLVANLWKGSLSLVYPTNNSQESATILANSLRGSKAVIQFVDEDNKIIYGVLCDLENATNKGYQNLINDSL